MSILTIVVAYNKKNIKKKLLSKLIRIILYYGDSVYSGFDKYSQYT